MYKRVLMALDASPEAVKTAEHVAGMAKSGLVGRVTLVHAVLEADEEKPRWPGEYGVEMTPARPVNLETRLVVEARLAPALDVFEEAGVPVDLQILVGDPAEVVRVLVEKGEYDLVVTGSRGLNHLEGVLMGSISSRVLASAGCPVMVLNPIPKGVYPEPPKQFYEF